MKVTVKMKDSTVYIFRNVTFEMKTGFEYKIKTQDRTEALIDLEDISVIIKEQ